MLRRVGRCGVHDAGQPWVADFTTSRNFSLIRIVRMSQDGSEDS